MTKYSNVFDHVFLENHRQQSAAEFGFILKKFKVYNSILLHRLQLLPGIRRDLQSIRCGCRGIHERETRIYGNRRSMVDGSE